MNGVHHGGRIALFNVRATMRIRRRQTLLIVLILHGASAFAQAVTFEHFTLQHGISQSSVTSVLQDRQGFLWVGTTDGLNRYDGNAFTIFRRNRHDTTSIADNCILSMCEDPGGDIWLGTYNGGLIRYINREHRFIRCRAIDPYMEEGKDGITAIHIDAAGILWIGTNGTRLVRFDTRSGQTSAYAYADESTNTNINAIAEDTSGVIWLGTNGGGLHAFNKHSRLFRTHRHESNNPRSLPADFIYALCVDRKGRLWIGTEGGLCRLEEGRFQSYKYDALIWNSLSSNHITAIFEDSRGRLWIGTADQGLNSFDQAERKFVAYRHDPEDDRSLNCNAICCIAQDRSGILWIGTFGGGINKLVQARFANYSDAFQPDSMHDNTYVAPLVITSFKVFGNEIVLPQALSVTEQITLSFPENSFSCEFAALDYTSPERNQYAYMLEGVDHNWVKSGTRRYASYANLDDGDYTLRVIGTNSDGLWNDAGRSLRIRIVPPYWNRWWFSLAGFAIVLSILTILYRYRVSRLLEIERTRNRIARDLHDEVGSTLSSISYFAEAIRQDAGIANAPNTSRLLSLISESSSSAKDAMSDIVWAIDPSNDCWEKVAAKLRRFASDLFESKGIAYEIHIPATAPFTFPTIEHRRNFWLLFKEMVTNAARHSQCANVHIDLSVDGQSYCLVVVDNGIGFDPGVVFNGNGLRNMHARAELLGASLNLLTSPGHGTRWELQCPSTR